MFRIFTVLFLLYLDIFARAGGGNGFTGGDSFSGGGSFSGGSSFDGGSYLGGSDMVGGEPMFSLILFAMFVLFFMWGLSSNKQRVIRKNIIQEERNSFSGELAKLKKRDKNFSLSKFEKRCERPFKMIQEAWSKQDMSLARGIISDGVFERFSTQLEMNMGSGIHNIMKDVHVKRSSIVGLHSDEHYDTIHMSITAEAVDYTVRRNTTQIVHGSLHKDRFTEIWSFIRKPSARTLLKPGLFEGKCPNCSSPLKLSDTLQCQSCNSFITSGEYDWILSEITQAYEFDYDNKIPLNLKEMQAQDKGFSKQHIEDRTSVIFWKFASASMFADTKRIIKYVLNSFTDEQIQKQKNQDSNRHVYFADLSIGQVELLSLDLDIRGMDKANVLVRSSGHIESREIPGFYPPEYHKSRISEMVYVLERKTGVKSPMKGGLSSYRCPSCGAPLMLGNNGSCEYCGKIQNDGSLDWVLAEIKPLILYTAPLKSKAYSQRSKDAEKQNTYSNKEELIVLLIQIMNIDELQTQEELKYLKSIAYKQGMSRQRLNTLIDRYAGASYTLKPDDLNLEGKEEVESFFVRLVDMCLMDGKVVPQEVKLLRKIAFRLNFPEIRIRKIIKEESNKMYKKFS